MRAEWGELPAAKATEADKLDLVFHDKVRPFLKNYCFKCHSGDSPEGDLAIDVFEHALEVATTGRRRWKQIRDKLLAGERCGKGARARPVSGGVRGFYALSDQLAPQRKQRLQRAGSEVLRRQPVIRVAR